MPEPLPRAATSPPSWVAPLDLPLARRAAAPEYDCCLCGACCFDHDVLLSDGEAEQFTADADLRPLVYLYRSSGGLEAYFLRREPQTQRCLALAGELGGCACTIYPQRPGLCRDFEPGSPDCLNSRARHRVPLSPSSPSASQEFADERPDS